MVKLSFLNRDKTGGQLLIEALVAVSLMMVGMLGVFGVLSQSLGLNRVAADQYIAVNLASEGIELIKNATEYCSFGDLSVGGDYIIETEGDRQPREIDNPEGNDDSILKFEDGIYRHSGGGAPTKFRRWVNVQNIDGINDPGK